MPQGNYKNKKGLEVPKCKGGKNKSKNILKLKKDKPKKKPMNENKKLKIQLEKAIRAKIEDDTTSKASNDSTSLRLLKGKAAKGKGKKS